MAFGFQRVSAVIICFLFSIGILVTYYFTSNGRIIRGAPKPEGRFGNVVYGTNHVIIANSVPKTGSRTLHKAIKDTLTRNNINFTYLKVLPYDREKTITKAQGLNPPAYIYGHTWFYPFTNWENPPIYINFFRDPVSRMMSHYYFDRHGDGHKRGRDENNTRTIESCIDEEKVQHCVPWSHWSSLLCGYDDRCKARDARRMEDRWLIEKAKENIDKYYTFIGLTEEFETSLRILEQLIPDLLGGLVESYRNPIEKVDWAEVYKTNRPDNRELSPQMVTKARGLMKNEQELYDYAYAKFGQFKIRFGLE